MMHEVVTIETTGLALRRPGHARTGAGDPFATYLGWTMPWGTPLTLIGDSPQQVADAQRQLARIGIDRPAAATRSDQRPGRRKDLKLRRFRFPSGAVHIPFWDWSGAPGRCPPARRRLGARR